MRDRRNTSVSSADSDSSSTRTAGSSFDEKRTFSPSPTTSLLPGPVTKENRSWATARRRTAAKILAAICVMILLLRYAVTTWIMPCQKHLSTVEQGSEAELVGSYDLPDEPTALMVSTPSGHAKWTISIPLNYSFPLSRHYYNEICSNGAGLRQTIDEKSGHTHGKHLHWLQRRGARHDQTFIDVEDAQANGMLPKGTQEALPDTCDTSLTFVLESEEASFGKSLLLLWLSFGLAKKEGRAFFIDDTRWAWGKYASFFTPPPTPKCTRPQPHRIVPCPANAKHLVVSSATAVWTFGPAFQKEFRAPHAHGVRTQSRIYGLLRTGYEELFKLTKDDAVYAAQRITKVKSDAVKHQAPVIGMQIRRGDQHPFEFQYSRDYLPLERYSDAAISLWNKHSPADVNGESTFLIASDDPDMFTSNDLQQAVTPAHLERAQDRILLATKATLDETSPVHPGSKKDSPYVKYMDENSGWEGGFFSALFYSAGGAAPPKQGSHVDVPEQALRLRELVGRAYLLDMAVLGSSDGVVCAISSASCRVLGVMMGWDAVKAGRWKNIDDGRPWSWDGSR